MTQADAFAAEPGFHFPLAAVAEIFGVSEVQVRNYVKQGMPQVARGRYDVRECVQWLIDHKCASSKSVTETSSASELNIARRRKIDLELAQAAGALVPVEQCAQSFVAIATAVANALDALGPRVAPVVMALGTPTLGDIERAVFDEARAVRAQVADEIDRFAAALGGEGRAVLLEEHQAAPKPRKRRARKVAPHDQVRV